MQNQKPEKNHGLGWVVCWSGKINNQVYHDLLVQILLLGLKHPDTTYGSCKMEQPAIKQFKEKFNGRIISNKTDVMWPPNNPDLNLLNYLFWEYNMQESFMSKPSTIDTLKAIVEELF